VKNKSAVIIIGALAGLIAFALRSVFIQFPTMPDAASAQAAFVDSAWNGLLIVESTIYALVMAFLIYCLYAFRATNRSEQGQKFDQSRGRFVEVTWLIASTALTLALAALGSHELRALVSDPSADIDVEVRAQQFNWEFYYPSSKQYGTKLFMEKGKRHRIILTSKDVVHSFWVPEFRLKQDAVPGKVTSIILTPTKTGSYTLLCNQLCGWGHSETDPSLPAWQSPR
jgi:cytochrome c oxidase subunit 2